MVATVKVEDKDVWVYEGQIYIPNTYTAGEMGTEALTQLMENKKIMGVRCPDCDRVYVPARSTCMDCFGKMDQFVEVGVKGTVSTYAVSHHNNNMGPVDKPVYAVIQLEGADNGFVHMLGDVEEENISVGMRVEAVFKDKEYRKGSILDIQYFKPL